MLKVDFHTHSLASHHALNSIEEILQQADQLGMAGVAITDHGPGTDNSVQIAQNPNSAYHWSERIKGPDTHFFKVFLSRYEAPRNIQTKLFKGIECNILGSGDEIIDLPKNLAADFDIVIASVHPLPYIFELQDQKSVADRIILAMDAGADVIGHPFHKTFELDQELIVAAAADKGVALELNNSSLRLKKALESSILKMLGLAKSKGCKISLASDAHATNELGSDECIRPLLSQSDFPEELIINNSLESACRFVNQRKKIRIERVV